ncbi:Os04g0385650, partial [Oryza sativa Japonica Group]
SFVLFKNFCKICKIICLHKNIFNNESNDRKIINNYLNFLNKTNGQTCLKKSTASNNSKRREYNTIP